MTLLPVEDAQLRLLSLANPLPVENVDLLSARGRILAEPLFALRDQPWADLSAMDGYAIRLAEMPGPWRLAGESRTGAIPPASPLPLGSAMRIFTGAPLPADADAVLIQEDSRVDGEYLRLEGKGPTQGGHNVRTRASDFAKDQPLLEMGCTLGPAQIALAAMAGHATLPVYRKPRVALIGTGDELRPVGEPLRPGQIPASNSVMLASMLIDEGAEVIDLGIFPDDLGSITDGFRAGAQADIVVSTGGASVGDHDLVAPAILAAGGTIDFWKIAMRPGKPLMAGRIGEACLIGLPGNPVSAFVGASLFLLPLVRKLGGAPAPLPSWTELPCALALPPGGIRAEYLRALVHDGTVIEVFSRDSAALRALASANALIERPIDAAATVAGDVVRVLPIRS